MKDWAIAELYPLICGCCAVWDCPWCGHANVAVNAVADGSFRAGLNECACGELTEVAP